MRRASSRSSSRDKLYRSLRQSTETGIVVPKSVELRGTYIAVVYLHMLLQVGARCKQFSADLTSIRLLPRVNTFVSDQITYL